MEYLRKEPRSEVMTAVEAKWEDETQTPRVASATMENRARGGVCIRIATPIPVGSKLTMKTYREQFSGVVVNARADDKGYLLGIKLDPVAKADFESAGEA